MTLFKQMALAVSLIIIVTLGAVMVINYHSAKQNMIQSLYETTANNISTLSNNLANASQDSALLVTTIDAEFDSGYYKKIEYISHDGEFDYLQVDSDPVQGVPLWFINFTNIKLQSVSADVTSGWNMAGVVHVTGDTGVVYKALYKMFKNLLYVFVISVFISLIILAVILHFVLKPLKEVQKQAEAVGRNEFIFQKNIPKTKEFQEVVLAMNKMVFKVKATFDKGNEELKRQKELEYIDPITKLRNRKYLIDKLPHFLKIDATSKGGVNIMTSLSGLIEANQQIGHKEVDQLLNTLANIFTDKTQAYKDTIIARMNGTEFSIFIPDCPSTQGLLIAESISKAATQAIAKYKLDSDLVFIALGVHQYNYKQERAQLLSASDTALAKAKFKDSRIYVDKQDEKEDSLGKDDWRALLNKALETNSFEFVSRSVVDSRVKKITHNALSITMQVDNTKYYYGQFMACANHIGLSPKIYQNIIRMMFTAPDIKLKNTVCSLRLSFEYMNRRETYAELSDLLTSYAPKLPFKLIIEIPDKMFSQNTSKTQEYKALFEKYTIDMGIYEFIGESDDYQYLQNLRPIYIKADLGYFLSQSDQALSALKLITDTLDITLIATGVMSMEELEKLQAKDIYVIQGKVAQMIDNGAREEIEK